VAAHPGRLVHRLVVLLIVRAANLPLCPTVHTSATDTLHSMDISRLCYETYNNTMDQLSRVCCHGARPLSTTDNGRKIINLSCALLSSATTSVRLPDKKGDERIVGKP